MRLLDDVGGPLDVRTLATQVNLHPNTVRDHLETLRQAGLVTRSAEERQRPGRPKMLYSAARLEARSPNFEAYRFLAQVLAGYMGANLDDPKTAAEEAGRAWGRYMVDRPEPFSIQDPVDAVRQIMTALAELGFSPEEDREESEFVVRLHDCPFREVARANTDVVCGVHLGILRGMADELADPVTIEDLRPFVEPSLCLAHISLSPMRGLHATGQRSVGSSVAEGDTTAASRWPMSR